MNLNYNGWKTIGNITITYSVDDYVTINDKKIKKAYISETSNKKSIEAAKQWGRGYDSTTSNYIYPTTVETENEGFSFQIASAAGGSSQGGKLSFWMCVMEKDGIEPFAVGINSELLADVILETDMFKGAIKEKVFFARKNGQLGVLHSAMKSYQDLLNDEETKKVMKGKKTSKWKIGYVYRSLTQADVFFGYLDKIADFSYGSRTSSHTTLTLDFTTTERVPLYYSWYDKYDNKDTFNFNEVVYSAISWRSYTTKSCPARIEGEQVFVETDDYYQRLAKTYYDKVCDDAEHFSRHIKGVFNLFRYNPSYTIDFLTKMRDFHKEKLDDLRHLFETHEFPDWMDSNVQKRILDAEKGKKLYNYFYTENPFDSVENLVKYADCLRHHEPYAIIYNGEVEFFTIAELDLFFDRLLEIAEVEKKKLLNQQ